MSPCGRSERLNFLRDSIARIEAGSPAPESARGDLVEVLPARPGDGAAAAGFALALARRRAGLSGAIIWISDDMTLAQRGTPYAPGLEQHDVFQGRVVFIRAQNPRMALWAMEEALRSPAPAVVLGEVWDMARQCGLTVTRRLLFAARTGGALGLLLHPAPAPAALSTAARQRFEVRALAGAARPSAGGRRMIFGAPAWRATRLKGNALEALTYGEEHGVALSQPAHQDRACA